MHRVTVHYSPPADPEAFDRDYAADHVPLVEKLPGLQAFSTSKVRPLGGEPTLYMIAELDFADSAALKTALGSPEMAAAGKHAAGLGAAMAMFTGEVVPAV